MKISYRIVLLILGMFPLMSTLAFSVPGLISYKGQLTDASGGTITDPVDVTFTLWDAETGGAQLGSGFSDTDSVTPNADGIYDTLIGDDNNHIPGAIFENDPVWLNVNVDGEDLSSRTRLTPVGAALQAGDADTVDGLEGADLEESADIATNAAGIATNANAIAANATVNADNVISISELMALIADLQNQIYAEHPTPTPTPIPDPEWNQLGDDIDGEADYDYSGSYEDSMESFSYRPNGLSSDGSIVAIGAYYNDGNGNKRGHVRVYQFQ